MTIGQVGDAFAVILKDAGIAESEIGDTSPKLAALEWPVKRS